MKYEVIPQDETVVVKITDDGITEQLSLMEPPGEESSLVQKSRKDVLGEINLEKMLSNLDNCVDLLQITFNAVDGFNVQPKVQELSNRFLDAMTESNVTALDFKLATESVLEAYINAYGNLFYGEVDTALMLLTDTKDVAAQMVKKADKLVVVFNGLTNYTNSVLKEVMSERSADEEKRNETKALINELQGSLNAMNALKENLQNDINQANSDYEKLQKRELKQEERAYNMQLASMIIGAVSGLFGVASEAIGDSKEDRDNSENQTASETGETSAEVQAKRDYTENVGKQEQKKSLIMKLDQRIAAIDKILDGQLYKDGANHAASDAEDLDTQKTGEELRKEKQDKVEEKGRLHSELSKLKGEEGMLGKTLSGFGVVMEKVSEDTRNAAQEIQKTADSLAERMDSIEKKRNELKNQERENLVKLANSTAKMQNMVMDENALESAIQCLVIAIGCLRRVLAYLHEIKLFWANVETFCNNLAQNSNITKLISMQGNKEPEQKAAYFKTILFVKGYIGMVAKWQALYGIFSNYLVALAKVSKRMSDTMEQSLSADRKEQWKLATKLSGELNAKLKEEIVDKLQIHAKEKIDVCKYETTLKEKKQNELIKHRVMLYDDLSKNKKQVSKLEEERIQIGEEIRNLSQEIENIKVEIVELQKKVADARKEKEYWDTVFWATCWIPFANIGTGVKKGQEDGKYIAQVKVCEEDDQRKRNRIEELINQSRKIEAKQKQNKESSNKIANQITIMEGQLLEVTNALNTLRKEYASWHNILTACMEIEAELHYTNGKIEKVMKCFNQLMEVSILLAVSLSDKCVNGCNCIGNSF